MVDIPQGYETLLERPLYGHLATTRPDGNAQVNPMWFDWDGELLRFTHTNKRQKFRNIEANPHVAMSVSDPDNPYRYLEVRGRVAERTNNGADQHIDAMAKKYLGKDKYPYRQPGEVRVIYKVAPERTTST